MTRYLTLLKDHPGFTKLWTAQVISLLGDWFSTIVLAAMVTRYASGTAYAGLAVSALFLTQTLPPLLFSPVAGSLVDRFDRKTLLIWSNFLRIFTVLGLLFVNGAETLWLLYTLRVLQFIFSAVFEPGQSALVPALVTRSSLTIANTLLSTTWSVMLAVGAVLGGIVGAVFGAQTALLIDAATFLVAGLVIMSIPDVKSSTPILTDEHTDEEPDYSFQDALRYLCRNPKRISPLVIKFAGSLGNMDTILTFYATSIFVLGSQGELSLGVLYSAFGVGAIIGPILMNRFHDGALRSLRWSVLVGFLWITSGWVFLSVAPALWIATGAIMLRAMGNSVNWVYSTTMIQKSFPDHYMGRAFSIDMAGFYLASVLSLIVHGLLIDTFGVEHLRAIVLGTAAVSFIPVVGWALFVAKQRDNAPESAASWAGE